MSKFQKEKEIAKDWNTYQKDNNAHFESVGGLEALLSFETSDKLIEIIEKTKMFVEKNTSEKDNSISTSQLRNFFDEAKKCDTWHKLWMLRPKIAYAYARQKKEGLRATLVFLDTLIEKHVGKDTTKIKAFKNFMEMLVSYQKYFEEVKKQLANDNSR
jgi:CRISPR type III-A-associated protein Csm2